MTDLYLLGIVVGGGAIIASVASIWKIRCVRRWPTIRGRVVSSAVHGSFKRIVDNDWHWIEEAVVNYTYTVAGRDYTSRRIAPVEGNSGSRLRAEAKVAKHPVGSEVEVIYSPANPVEAYLSSSADTEWVFWLLLPVGAAMLVTCVVCWVRG